MTELHELPRSGDWPDAAIGGVHLAHAGGPMPTIELTLDDAAVVRCRYSALAWKEPAIRLVSEGMDGDPDLVTVQGPGRLALAGGQAGAAVPLRLTMGERILLSRPRVLLATADVHAVTDALFSTVEPDLAPYEATEDSLVVLYGGGSVFGATLGEAESIDVAPHALLYADVSVMLDVVGQPLGPDAVGVPVLTLVRCGGPGRIAIQSLPASQEL